MRISMLTILALLGALTTDPACLADCPGGKCTEDTGGTETDAQPSTGPTEDPAKEPTTTVGPGETGDANETGGGEASEEDGSDQPGSTEASVCGDGVVQPGEECDDGDNNDDHEECTSECRIATCGDGIEHYWVEKCDDGPLGSSMCTADCEFVCGNGVLQPGEECDDGNVEHADSCSAFCKKAKCADGIVQYVLGEECDDGNTNNNDDCTTTCENAMCGDGVVKFNSWFDNEECDLGPNNNDEGACTTTCENAMCGDGLLFIGHEECDDGNYKLGDGCELCHIVEVPTVQEPTHE